jgi:hypothetical protein
MPVPSHHPEVTRLADGRFVARCVKCEVGDRLSIPVGIGIPLQSSEVAEFVRNNHVAGTTLKVRLGANDVSPQTRPYAAPRRQLQGWGTAGVRGLA